MILRHFVAKRPSLKRILLLLKAVAERGAGNPLYVFFALSFMFGKKHIRTCLDRENNISFDVYVVNWITHFRWYLFNKKEVEVRNFVNKNLSEGDTFLDVGANVGIFSIYAASKYSSVTVVSIEPLSENFSILVDNIKLNCLESQILPIPLAVSSRGGMATFNIQDSSVGAAANSISLSGGERYTDEGYLTRQQREVSVSTLDELCFQRKIFPSLIKIDTDGHEVAILNGAKAILLGGNIRSLAIEIQPLNLEAVTRLLLEFGYVLKAEDSVGNNHFFYRKVTVNSPVIDL